MEVVLVHGPCRSWALTSGPSPFRRGVTHPYVSS